MVRTALGTAVAVFVSWMVVLLIGLSAANASAIVITRTVVCCVVLAMVSRFLARRGAPTDGFAVAVAVSAFLAYAVSPQAWAGRALVGQALVSPGILTFLIDLVIWMAVVLLACASLRPSVPAVPRAPYAAGQ